MDSILNDYKKAKDRNCIILFLTDGYPNEGIPNEEGQYNYLKNQYPFITVNGVQYEMGDTVLDPIKKVSDNQFIADMETLNNVLFQASVSPVVYKEFEITDYIDTNYFYVESESDIKVSQGKIIFDKYNQKFTWKIDNLKSGLKTNLKINAKLKDKLAEEGGFYPTNEKEEIKSIIDEDEEYIMSSKTPVLKDDYKVIYDGNAPRDCRISGVPAEKHYSVFDIIAISDSVPKCDGYRFKGWKITTKNAKKINDDYFMMPEEDVVVTAEWGNLDIKKSMEGTIKEKLTLYKQVQEDAKNSSKFAKKYDGDTSTFKGNEDVYYYYGQAKNNNVIFANYCWKMMRTTDTGGVKLLYNGIPSDDGKCNNTGSSSILNSTQMNTSSDSISFNSSGYTPAAAGYMYNKKCSYDRRFLTHYQNMSRTVSFGDYWYSDEYHYDVNTARYYLDNPQKMDKNNLDDIVGKYSFLDSTTGTNYSELYYILKVENSTIYYLTLDNGHKLNDASYETTITFGMDIEDNGDGSSSLVSSVTIDKVNWKKVYSNFKDYYTCGDNSITCSSEKMKHIVTPTISGISYVYIDEIFKFGNSVVYEDGVYKLQNTKDINNLKKEYNDLNNYHYSCFNDTGVCTKAYYVYLLTGDFYVNSVELTNGKNIENVLDEMLFDDDVNMYDSDVKKAIDFWYANNMTDYTFYLEDTVWCNDRILAGYNSSGWNPNGGTYKDFLYFGSARADVDLKCFLPNDEFTVSKENGNGALTYPVGLPTRKEMQLATYNYNNPFSCGTTFWTMSPAFFESEYLMTYNSSSYSQTVSKLAVRPSISLCSDIEYKSGDGSSDLPYLIDMGEEFSVDFDDDLNVYSSVSSSFGGKKISLYSKDDRYKITSFKVNGSLVTGNTFIMPNENVLITDVILDEFSIIESEHNPYSNNLNDVNEKTFEGATSLTVELDYQTESTSYDWIYLYDGNGKQYGKYGGTTRKNESITIPGDYVKIVFRTDGSVNDYYGYKATIIPNYD